VEGEQYQAWIEKFGETTQHIYVNSKATGAAPIMTSSAAIQARPICFSKAKSVNVKFTFILAINNDPCLARHSILLLLLNG